jgi:Protein of unknown function (DUF4058)
MPDVKTALADCLGAQCREPRKVSRIRSAIAGIIRNEPIFFLNGERTAMPIHDWTLVDAGLFHAFHQDWIGVLARALNAGVLPDDYFALREQSIRDPIPDVLTLKLSEEPDGSIGTSTGLAVAAPPPRARLVRHAEDRIYARKADRIAVRHRHGHIVSVVEIVSPGNKASKNELRAFVEKTANLIVQGVHLLVIDLFPPSNRDPQGIHKAIWDEFIEEDFALPADQPLTVAAYDAGPPAIAYVEQVAVGDALPSMPIFLKPDFYVPAPLDETYRTTWDEFFPAPMKRLLQPAK